jgi:hypothetical protein
VTLFLIALGMITGSIWIVVRLFRSGTRIIRRAPAAGTGPVVTGARPADFEIEE